MHITKFELILKIFIFILSGSMKTLNGTKFLSRKRKIVSLTFMVNETSPQKCTFHTRELNLTVQHLNFRT